jgi:superfamily II DNA or RNA helicase
MYKLELLLDGHSFSLPLGEGTISELVEKYQIPWRSMIETSEGFEAPVRHASFKFSLVLADVSDVLSLYPWQREALEWWRSTGYCGVVEAVTGAGKTRLALAAAAEQLRNGLPVVVIVPTLDLLRQWEQQFLWLQETLNRQFTIGMLGGRRDDRDREPAVLLATAQTACREYLLPTRPTGLIVADEVHHYGAERWSLALEEKFDRRLGLTGTYEREDSGLDEILDPYFGGNVFSVDYQRALEDDVIAPFKIAFIAVGFSSDEREEYEAHDDGAYRSRTKLIQRYGLPEEPFGDFIREVHRLAQGGADEATGLARWYLGCVGKGCYA